MGWGGKKDFIDDLLNCASAIREISFHLLERRIGFSSCLLCRLVRWLLQRFGHCIYTFGLQLVRCQLCSRVDYSSFQLIHILYLYFHCI